MPSQSLCYLFSLPLAYFYDEFVHLYTNIHTTLSIASGSHHRSTNHSNQRANIHKTKHIRIDFNGVAADHLYSSLLSYRLVDSGRQQNRNEWELRNICSVHTTTGWTMNGGEGAARPINTIILLCVCVSAVERWKTQRAGRQTFVRRACQNSFAIH